MRVPRIGASELAEFHAGESSAAILERVARARRIQAKRFAGRGISCNAEMTSRDLEEFCELSTAVRHFLADSIERLGLGARAFARVLKVARSIADLSGDAAVSQSHIGEALRYRNLDRDLSVRD